MNPIPAERGDDQNVVEFAESPGRRLRLQRQARGLEIERIATQLHLRPDRVEALEQDRYEDLPGPVFVAGYIRNYARLLGIDPQPLIEAYRHATPGIEPPVRHVTPAPVREIGSGHILVRLISLALLAAVIGMLVFWWQNRADLLPAPYAETEGEAETGVPGSELSAGLGLDPVQVEPEESADAVPMLPIGGTADTPDTGDDASALPPEPGDARIEPAAVLTAESAPTGVDQDADATGPSAVDAAAQAPEAPEMTESPEPAAPEGAETATAASREIELSFSGPCWIDVRDAGGGSVLIGEMAKGDQRVLQGNPPFSFVIGNVTATTMTVGGEPFDLVERSRGNVARFKLDPDSDG
jgi:cytoskeleton protein RodZ